MWLTGRVAREPPARVADLGCGQGHSTLALADAYPLAAVDGIDLDAASIDDAIRFAQERGIEVTFAVRDAATLADSGPYDLICIFEALHDMGPAGRNARFGARGACAGGVVLIAGKRATDPVR